MNIKFKNTKNLLEVLSELKSIASNPNTDLNTLRQLSEIDLFDINENFLWEEIILWRENLNIQNLAKKNPNFKL